MAAERDEQGDEIHATIVAPRDTDRSGENGGNWC
jgi:hypothetical protein